MVYIYKKVTGSNSYFYLRASIRNKQGKIVVKDIAYLGNSLDEVKNALSKLPRYEKEIRKAYKTINNFVESNHYIEKAQDLKLKHDDFLNEKLIDVEACKLHYNSIFKHKDDITRREIMKNFIIEFTYNTTSIEGNTINLNEARNLLQEGRTPKDKTLREIYDIQNTEKAFNFILELLADLDISHEFIIEIHKRLMENIDMRIGYRMEDNRVVKANFKSTPAPYVKTDMDLLLNWFNEKKNKLHPIVLAAIFHHKFEKIHPFMDGNGRTGRLLFNFILLKSGYPPAIILKKNRKAYLQSLRIADNSLLSGNLKEHYKQLIDFTTDELSEGYWNLFL